MNQVSDRGACLPEDMNEKDYQSKIDGSIECSDVSHGIDVSMESVVKLYVATVKEGSGPLNCNENYTVTLKKDIIAGNDEVVEDAKGIITYQKRKRQKRIHPCEIPTNDLEITKEDAGSSSHGVAHTVGTTSSDQPVETESVTHCCSESMSEKTMTAEDTFSVEVVCTNKLLDKDVGWVLGFHGTSPKNDEELLIAHSNENCHANMLALTLPEMENDEATINRSSCDTDMLDNNLLGEVDDEARKTVSILEGRNVESENKSNFARVAYGDALSQDSLQQPEQHISLKQSSENCDAEMLALTLPEMENDEATINRNSCDADILANNLLGEVDDEARKTVSIIEARNVELEEESNFARVAYGDALCQDSLQKPEQQLDANISLKQSNENCDADMLAPALAEFENDEATINRNSCDADMLANNLLGEVDDEATKTVSIIEARNVELEDESNFTRVHYGDALSQDSLQQSEQQLDATISLKQLDSLKGVTSEVVNEGINVAVDRSLAGYTGKKLLVLDVNGLLVDISAYVPYDYDPDDIIMRKAVFKRPYCDDFLKFCFERFNVGVWTSRTKRNVEPILELLLGNDKCNLLFVWDQSQCTHTGFTTVENRQKPLLLKKLKKLWDKCDPDLPWERGLYNESNTLLLDDTPSKALFNPLYNAIFPYTYRFRKTGDNSLGPGGDLRIYLEGLALAENVQEYVKQNPFGQRAITEKNLSWGYYRRVIEACSRPPWQTEQKDDRKVIEARSTPPLQTELDDRKVIEARSTPPQQTEQDDRKVIEARSTPPQQTEQDDCKVIEACSTPPQPTEQDDCKVIEACSTPPQQTEQQDDCKVIEACSTPPRQTEQQNDS